jgi:hypothetical protein
MKILIDHVSRLDPENVVILTVKSNNSIHLYPPTDFIQVFVLEVSSLEDLFKWYVFVKEKNYNNFGGDVIIASAKDEYYQIDWSSVPEDVNRDVCLRVYDYYVE